MSSKFVSDEEYRLTVGRDEYEEGAKAERNRIRTELITELESRSEYLATGDGSRRITAVRESVWREVIDRICPKE